MAYFRQRMSRDQHWSLLILTFPSDIKKSVIAFFVIYFALCYSYIPSRDVDTTTDMHMLLQFLTKYLDYCWCFNVFYYPTFLIHRNVRMEIRYRWVLFKIEYFIGNLKKMGGGDEMIVVKFCNLNETLFFMFKYTYTWVIPWFFKSRKDPSCHITYKKYQKFGNLLIKVKNWCRLH